MLDFWYSQAIIFIERRLYVTPDNDSNIQYQEDVIPDITSGHAGNPIDCLQAEELATAQSFDSTTSGHVSTEFLGDKGCERN